MASARLRLLFLRSSKRCSDVTFLYMRLFVEERWDVPNSDRIYLMASINNHHVQGGSKKHPQFRSHKSVIHQAILLKFYTHILWLFKSYVLKFCPNISVQCRVMLFCAHPTISFNVSTVMSTEHGQQQKRPSHSLKRNTHTCTESTSHISTSPYPCQLPVKFLSISAHAGQTQCSRWTKS